jgi:hypothetical protein
VAVRAQQNAFLCLGAKASDPLRPSSIGDRECLRGRVEMMELKRCGMLVEAAEAAVAACLLYELALD